MRNRGRWLIVGMSVRCGGERGWHEFDGRSCSGVVDFFGGCACSALLH
jgi:hypothetical protein